MYEGASRREELECSDARKGPLWSQKTEEGGHFLLTSAAVYCKKKGWEAVENGILMKKVRRLG